MAREGERFMRILIFFDLPTKTQSQRSVAAGFRGWLIKDGYQMLQWSVYARICKGQDGVEKHTKRIRMHTPENGNVRMMIVTEKQYASMEILVGTLKKIERIGPEQLVLL